MSQANERSSSVCSSSSSGSRPPSTHYELLVIKFLFGLMQCNDRRPGMAVAMEPETAIETPNSQFIRRCLVRCGCGRGRRGHVKRGGITASPVYSGATVRVATPLIAVASIFSRLSFVLRATVSFFCFHFHFNFYLHFQREREGLGRVQREARLICM